MFRIRLLPGALFCYALSYAVLIALAMRKEMDFDVFSLCVWLLSALLIFVTCAIAPILIKVVARLSTTTFVLLWAGTIAALGIVLVSNAK